MSFSDKQVRALSRGVPADAIRTRMSSGKELTFIEGWYALAQANRIFGFDGWDRETVETKCIQAREARGTFTAIYSAKVRITVRTADAVVVREGHGTGEANGGSSGEVQDRALKAAETDATKRALATFGKAFGLALYAGVRRTTAKRLRPPASAAETKRVPTAATPAPSMPAAVVEAPVIQHHPDVSAAPAKVEDTAAEIQDAAKAEAAPVKAGDVQAKAENAAAKAGATVSEAPSARPITAPAQRIDKNLLAFPEPRRVRDKDHLRYVAVQPCLLCSTTPLDPHHLRFAQPRAMARKVGDDFTVPLCRKHHRDLHDSGNEAAWWHAMGTEPLEIAKDLWEESETTRQMFANLRLDEARPTINGETKTPPVSNGGKHAVD